MNTNTKKQNMVNLNGTLCAPKDAKISLFDRGLLFGDSIYEVIRSYQGKIFLLDEHLQRLENSAQSLGISLPLNREELTKEIKRTFTATQLLNAYIRIIVTRGTCEEKIDISPDNFDHPNYYIIVNALSDFPVEWYTQGYSILIGLTQRTSPLALHPKIKSGNYLNNIIALSEAKNQQVHDTLLLDQEGFATECTTSNFWMVKEGILFTPPLSVGILLGITRQQIFHLAKNLGLSVQEKKFKSDEILAADECFLTSTLKEIVPITTINGRPIGSGRPGPITSKLIAEFKNHVNTLLKLS